MGPISECLMYIGMTAFIPFSYIGLIYLFGDSNNSRDHPRNIRKRTQAALLSNLFSILATFYLLSWNFPNPLYEMGFRAKGMVFAAILPTFATALFYLGTFVNMHLNGWRWIKDFLDVRIWKFYLRDPVWVRDAIMAPLTEELAFRACTVPLVTYCLGPGPTTFVAPLFFSLCHFHHILDDQKRGLSLREALLDRGFQASYTYLFGVYATYLFQQTGHILTPILSHSLCNCLGLPHFENSKSFPKYLQPFVFLSHIVGFVMWAFILPLVTDPRIYQ